MYIMEFSTVYVDQFSCSETLQINILNSCPTQGMVEGWDAMKPL